MAAGELGKKMQWQDGSWQKTALHAATAAASARLSGQSNATVAVSALSPFANQGIKRLTTDNNGETNLIPNILAHAALGALEAKATGNNVTAGAIAGGGGELLAHGIAKAYYGVDGKNKTTADLTEIEKHNIKTISQLGSAVAGGLIGDSTQSAVNAADIAKRAVENNLLSKQEDKALYDLSEEFQKKGALTQGKQEISAALLSKDSEIERLIYINQTAPQQLTNAQRAYLDRELKIIAASYNIPVENLYNIDFSKTMKRDDSALKTYLKGQNALRNSYDMKQARSLKEGLEAAAFLNVGNVVAKVGTEAAVKAATAATQTKTGQRISQALSGTGLKEAGIYLANTAKQHPILAEKISNASLSAGFTYLGNTIAGEKTSVSDLLWSGGTGFIAGGKSFTATLGINTTSSGVKAITEGDDPFYASLSSATATIAGGVVGKGVEKAGYRALVGDIYKNKAYYEPKYRNQESYDLLNKEYKYYPAKFGIVLDPAISEHSNQTLEKYEKNIKNWIGDYNDK